MLLNNAEAKIDWLKGVDKETGVKFITDKRGITDLTVTISEDETVFNALQSVYNVVATLTCNRCGDEKRSLSWSFLVKLVINFHYNYNVKI